MVEKPVSYPFLKDKNKHICGSNFIQIAFILSPSQLQPKYIKVKVPTTCFYLI